MARLKANLRRRKASGIYYFRARIDGRDVWKSLKTRDHGMALTRFDREKGRRNAAQHDLTRTVPRETTVAKFAEAWLAEYVKQRRTPGGAALAGQRMRDHVAPVIGKLYLPEVTLPVIRRLRAELDTRLAPQSVRHVLADLRCLLRYAAECGVIDTVPAVSRAFPVIPERIRRLSDEQVGRILEAAGPAHRAIIRFLLLTGLRWSEFTGLTWSQVRDLPVPHLELDLTKTGRVRRVPLWPEARAVLEELRKVRVGNRAGKKGARSLMVSPIRSKNAGHMAALIGARVGFRWGVHQLRHTFAARYLEHGGSIAALQEILGHRSPVTTQRYSSGRETLIFMEAAVLKLTSGFSSNVVAEAVAVAGSGADPLDSSAR